jgi:hypothetical protein
MNPGLERCPPAQPHWQSQSHPAAKFLTANKLGGALFLGLAEELLQGSPWTWKAALQGQHGLFNLCGLCPSAAWRGMGSGNEEEVETARTHSLMAGLTLDKQLQSIYLRPYGVGEQVCR